MPVLTVFALAATAAIVALDVLERLAGLLYDRACRRPRL